MTRNSSIGQAMWFSTLLLVLVAVPAEAAPEDLETFVFVCDDTTSYTVRTTPTEAWVFRPQGTLRLPKVLADEGMRYTDKEFELRIDGQRAWLGQATGKPSECRNDPRRAVWERAKLDGVDFRAVGNEPGWVLEIRELSRMVLVADYGETRVEVTLPAPSVDAETNTTRWDAGELVVEATYRPCRDTMSGEAFSSQVTVYWRGRVLRGCGRALH